MQHDLQLRAAARAHYDEEHFLFSPVPFETAEEMRSRSWRDAVEAAIADRDAVADVMVSMAQMSLII